MKNITMNLVLALALTGLASAQSFRVGDVVDVNFTEPISSNSGGMGEADWYLFDYNGALNGGEYRIIWLNFFAAW